MSRIEKLIRKLLSCPKDLTFDELCRIFRFYGYELSEKGNGSRVLFIKGDKRFRMHKPHPDNIVKPYIIIEAISFLTDQEGLNEELFRI